jgi:hypothetical protein
VKSHTIETRTESFLEVRQAGTTTEVKVPLKLVMTAVYGDEDPSNPWRQATCYIYVSVDHRVRYVTVSSHDIRGGWGSIPKEDQKRLDQLLSKLPDDGSRLPPPDRRVALQIVAPDRTKVRVYDRANAPDAVLDILRLTRSGIGPWVPVLKPEGEVQLPRHTYHHQILVTPNGFLLSATDDRLTFLDPISHRTLKETNPVQEGPFIPEELQLSPGRRFAAFAGEGWCRVLDATTWEDLPRFADAGNIGRSCPRFTADGRFLLVRCHDSTNDSVTLQAYDTTTGQKKGKLFGLPDGTMDYMEASSGKSAVILTKEKRLGLWDISRRREYAKLAEGVQNCMVVFSPDGSAVAVATQSPPNALLGPRGYRIRIWKTDTGTLMHELYPTEAEDVQGLQWTADARFVFAAMRWPSPDDYTVNIWSVQSGRWRGILAASLFRPIGGVVMLPDARHLAVSGFDQKMVVVVRFWDFAAVMKQIRTFEDSLAAPKAGK